MSPNKPTKSTKKIMIVAAEASGDLLGAEIIREIKSQYKSAEIIGVGGPEMAAAGQNQFFDVSELSVMGLLEIIPHLPRLFKLMQKLVGYAEAEQPDLLLTIDGQDFNKRLAKRIKAKLPIQAMHVVAPTVWAWRAGRAKEYAKIYDHLFTIFPFEATYFEKHGLDCSYIGHPLAHSMASWESKVLQGMPKAKRIALLPGSRVNEVSRVFPAFLEAFRQLRTEHPTLRGVIPVASTLDESWLRSFATGTTGLEFISANDTTKYTALQQCRAAISCSGTANLELALLGVPSVVVYKMLAPTYWLLKLLVHVPYISPVNWVAGEKIYPELMQGRATPEAISKAVTPLLVETHEREEQAKGMAFVREQLASGAAAAQIVAERLLAAIK